jgi:hypothetical protein
VIRPKKNICFSENKTNRKIKCKEDPKLSHAYNILESISNIPRDECTTFGEHIVTKLHKFNNQRRSILMHRINNLIFDAEMELYSQQEFAQPTSVYSTASSTASPSVCFTPQFSPSTSHYHSQPHVPETQLLSPPSSQEQLHEPSSSPCNTLQEPVTNYRV